MLFIPVMVLNFHQHMYIFILAKYTHEVIENKTEILSANAYHAHHHGQTPVIFFSNRW